VTNGTDSVDHLVNTLFVKTRQCFRPSQDRYAEDQRTGMQMVVQNANKLVGAKSPHEIDDHLAMPPTAENDQRIGSVVFMLR